MIKEVTQSRSLEKRQQLSTEPGFQSFEMLMADIKQKYRDEKVEVDQKVMITLKQQKNRIKAKEAGISYP